MEDPQLLEPAEREVHVATELDTGLTLHGYIDRVDEAPTGELRIVDYKTGKSPGPLFEAKAMFQMKFYALVVWRTRGVIPRMLQLVYLGNAEMLRYEPDEQDLLATERKVRALWDAITRANESGDWRPHRSALCGWCDHKALCPAWGGTPPPLPQSRPADLTGAAGQTETVPLPTLARSSPPALRVTPRCDPAWRDLRRGRHHRSRGGGLGGQHLSGCRGGT